MEFLKLMNPRIGHEISPPKEPPPITNPREILEVSNFLAEIEILLPILNAHAGILGEPLSPDIQANLQRLIMSGALPTTDNIENMPFFDAIGLYFQHKKARLSANLHFDLQWNMLLLNLLNHKKLLSGIADLYGHLQWKAKALIAAEKNQIEQTLSDWPTIKELKTVEEKKMLVGNIEEFLKDILFFQYKYSKIPIDLIPATPLKNQEAENFSRKYIPVGYTSDALTKVLSYIGVVDSFSGNTKYKYMNEEINNLSSARVLCSEPDPCRSCQKWSTILMFILMLSMAYLLIIFGRQIITLTRRNRAFHNSYN